VDQTSAQQRAKWVERWKDSGLTAKEFAEEAGLKAVARKDSDALGAERTGAAKPDKRSAVPSPRFVELPVAAMASEVMCLLPDWPSGRVLELAPCNWKQTREKPEAQQLIADNLWLSVLDAVERSHDVEL
jgi:hypothetical protein